MVELVRPTAHKFPGSSELMNEAVLISSRRDFERRSGDGGPHSSRTMCPSTMQVAKRKDHASNHTLQRLVRHWRACVCDDIDYRYAMLVELPAGDSLRRTASVGTPNVEQRLQNVAQGVDCYRNLRQLRILANATKDKENRATFCEVGAVPILANFIFSPENLCKDLRSCEEALATLTLLPLHDIRQKLHIGPKQLTTVSWLLNKGSLEAKANAATLLGSLALNDDEMKASVGATAGVFHGLVQLMKDTSCLQAIRTGATALKTVTTLIHLQERNTVRAVEAGVVYAVMELLPDAERRGYLRPLTRLMEHACACREGQEAMSAHALAVPMLARVISLRDLVASESAVACLWSVCQHTPKLCVNEAAGQAGLLAQLEFLSQIVDGKVKPETRQKANVLLRQLRYRMEHCHDRC